MTEKSRTILERYQVRKSKKQKETALVRGFGFYPSDQRSCALRLADTLTKQRGIDHA